MRKIVKRIFYNNHSPVEYPAITLNATIQEKAFLKCNGQTIDISENHWVLSLEPLVFAAWMNNGNKQDFFTGSEFSLSFEEAIPKKKLSEVKLNLLSTLREPEGVLLLLKAEKTHI